MSIGTILLVVLILMLVGVLPVWPHASTWGYGPSGAVGVIFWSSSSCCSWGACSTTPPARYFSKKEAA